MLNTRTESVEDVIGSETVENLLLIAVLGKDEIRRKACDELQRRRGGQQVDIFDDLYMTNLDMIV